MATIVLTIPDAVVPRVVNGLCGAEHLEPTAANAKTALINIARRTIRIQEEVIQQIRDEQAIDIT